MKILLDDKKRLPWLQLQHTILGDEITNFVQTLGGTPYDTERGIGDCKVEQIESFDDGSTLTIPVLLFFLGGTKPQQDLRFFDLASELPNLEEREFVIRASTRPF